MALALFTWRRLFVRLVAIVTCLVALGGIGASAYTYQRVDQAEREARAQLLQLSGVFSEISVSLLAASDSVERAAVTVDDAQASLTSVSTTTRGAASTLDETARIINFTIPGTGLRPLEGVDVTFREQARQLRQLATDVDQTGSSLGRNATDLRAIRTDVAAISTDMNDISLQLHEFAVGGANPGGLARITDGTRLMITWSIVIHVMLFGMGVAIYLLSSEPRYFILPPEPDRADEEYNVADLEAELYG